MFVGKLQLDALMSAWHQATKADFPDGKVPESDMTDFLNSLFGPTLAAEEKAEKLKLPRDVVHRLMNQMGAGKMVEGIPEPVHDLDDLNHAMMSVVGVVEVSFVPYSLRSFVRCLLCM